MQFKQHNMLDFAELFCVSASHNLKGQPNCTAKRTSLQLTRNARHNQAGQPTSRFRIRGSASRWPSADSGISTCPQMGPTRVGGRTTRQTRHRFALRRPESAGVLAAICIGITLSRARELLVVPRWFLTKFPIYGTAPQHKLSRVKPLGYAARQLTIELPTSSDKVWWSENI
jgi:hypothetical protein